MINLVYKHLKFDRLKSLLTVLALGSVVSVILILEGFEQGQYWQLKQMVLNRNADLIATQSGVKNFIATRSVIPQMSRAKVEAVNGVVEAHPITALPIIYNQNNQRTPVYVFVYVFVYDTVGGPSQLLEGVAPQSGANIVIDKSLADKYQLQPGDPFWVTDFKFTIAGITNESAFMMPFAFINYDGMLDLFLESEIAPDLSTFPLLSYLLIELSADANKLEVMAEIEATVPSVDVYTADDIASNDVALGRTFFSPIMGVLVSVGYVIGLLVISLIMYSEIRTARKNYALLKALGFSLRKLFKLILLQSVSLLFLAIPVGTVLALVTALLIESGAPVYYIKIMTPDVFYQTLSACLVFALVGGLLPLISIHRCDPMMAFQAS